MSEQRNIYTGIRYNEPEQAYTGMESHNLERVRYGIAQVLSRELLNVEVTAEIYADEILMRIRHDVFVEKFPEHTISYPEDWWQAFKERWFTKFLLRRYPVRYTEHRISLSVLYPDMRPPLYGQRTFRHLEVRVK